MVLALVPEVVLLPLHSLKDIAGVVVAVFGHTSAVQLLPTLYFASAARTEEGNYPRRALAQGRASTCSFDREHSFLC